MAKKKKRMDVFSKLDAETKEIEQKKSRERKEIIYHRTLKKKNRAKIGKKLKNDYVDNAELYINVYDFQDYANKIILLDDYIKSTEFNKINETFKQSIYNIRNNFKYNYSDIIKEILKYNKIDHNDATIQARHIYSTINNMDNILIDVYSNKLDEYNKKKKILKDKIVIDIYKICNKLVKNYNFRGYSEAIKEDMIGFALTKILEIEPWEKFDVNRSNAVFSFMTRVVFNFFIQFIKKHYSFLNKKQDVLDNLIVEFNSKWCKSGISFNIADGIDYD